jgi:uncharacterized membrane protein
MLSTVAFLIACALIAVASIPLMLKLVPPNPIYGVRTRKTLEDAEVWYNVNVFGGRALLAASIFSALLLMMYTGTFLRPFWAQLIAFALPLVIAVGATLAYERKL